MRTVAIGKSAHKKSMILTMGARFLVLAASALMLTMPSVALAQVPIDASVPESIDSITENVPITSAPTATPENMPTEEIAPSTTVPVVLPSVSPAPAPSVVELPTVSPVVQNTIPTSTDPLTPVSVIATPPPSQPVQAQPSTTNTPATPALKPRVRSTQPSDPKTAVTAMQNVRAAIHQSQPRPVYDPLQDYSFPVSAPVLPLARDEINLRAGIKGQPTPMGAAIGYTSSRLSDEDTTSGYWLAAGLVILGAVLYAMTFFVFHGSYTGGRQKVGTYKLRTQ